MMRHVRLARTVAALAMLLSAGVAGAAVPTYALDAAKSKLEFSFVQAGAQNQGRFPKFTVNFSFADDNLAAAHLEVTVDIAALDTGDQERNDTLREADLFNVAKFPQARFANHQNHYRHVCGVRFARAARRDAYTAGTLHAEERDRTG